MSQLYMVEIFMDEAIATMHTDKAGVEMLVKKGLSLCINQGEGRPLIDRFLDVCHGEYMNPLSDAPWFI